MRKSKFSHTKCLRNFNRNTENENATNRTQLLHRWMWMDQKSFVMINAIKFRSPGKSKGKSTNSFVLPNVSAFSIQIFSRVQPWVQLYQAIIQSSNKVILFLSHSAPDGPFLLRVPFQMFWRYGSCLPKITKKWPMDSVRWLLSPNYRIT